MSDQNEHSISFRDILGVFGLWKVAAIVVIPFLVFGSILWLLNESEKSLSWIAHTYNAEGELTEFLSLMQDMETGQRGFILTGREYYLAPLYRASAQLDDDINDLRELLSDNTAQQERIERLVPLVESKVNELYETIALYRKGQADEALAVVKTDAGKMFMDEIRVIIGEMIAEENSLLIERQAESQKTQNLALFSGVASLILLVLVLLAVADALRRFMALRREAEERLEAARLLAEDASAAKSKFLATISHEIRTPLNGLLGTAQLLATTQMNERQTELVKNQIRSGQLLTDLLTDVLDMSKIEEGKLIIENEKFAINAQLSMAFSAYEVMAQQRGIDYQFKNNIRPSTLVKSDPVRIRQISMNLLSNAIKFTRAGSVSFTASIEKIDGQNQLKITVSDTGPGIAPEQQKAIFKEFQQLERTRNTQVSGTGLGLSIVKNIVAAMGGEITLDSDLGKGASFTILLPVEVSAEEAVDTEKRAIDYPDLSSLKVLVAEDVNINVMVIQGALAKVGIVADFAGDGEEALNKIMLNEPYDLVLMDFNMPKMDGITAIRAVRAMDDISKATTPIWGLTAETVAESLQEGFAAGMSDVVTKPIDFQSLFAKLTAFEQQQNAAE